MRAPYAIKGVSSNNVCCPEPDTSPLTSLRVFDPFLDPYRTASYRSFIFLFSHLFFVVTFLCVTPATDTAASIQVSDVTAARVLGDLCHFLQTREQ